MKKLFKIFSGLIALMLFSLLSFAQLGNSLCFEGAGPGGNGMDPLRDYVEVPDNGSMDLGDTYTIEAWIYLNDGANNTIIDKGNYRFLFQTHPNGQPGLGLYNNTMKWVYSPVAVSVGVWQHVAVTFDAINVVVKFYINGIEVSSHTMGNTGIPIANGGQDDDPINIGRQSPTTCACNNMDGNIDALRVWNIVRTPSEILANVNNELAGPLPALQASYPFNQGVAGADNSAVTTLVDISGNNNDGSLTSFNLTTLCSNWAGSTGLPVPTLGQWGLIILTLLLLSFGTVFIRRRQMVLAGEGVNHRVRLNNIPFNKESFLKVLPLVGLAVLSIFTVSITTFGYELTNTDIPGSLAAIPLLAYLVHLFKE